jgi:hypothetical protein
VDERLRDVLCAARAASRFVLAGPCSGAYWSFHGALQDERVVAAFMLNPRTLFWNASLENVRYLRRGLLRPSSWRMALQGDVRFSRVSNVALEELERQGRLSRGERWPNLELDLLPGRDHTLRPANSQQRAHDVLDRALEQELARTHA